MKRQSAKRWAFAARRRASRRQRRGSAILEFALALPFLLMLVLLCIDFGRGVYYYIVVTNAARAAAGYATTNTYPYSLGTSQTTWTNYAVSAGTAEAASNLWVDTTKLTVSVPGPSKYSAGSYWTVSATATYPFKTLINWSVLSSTYNTQKTLSRTVYVQGSM